MSMKPGHTTLPVESTTVVPAGARQVAAELSDAPVRHVDVLDGVHAVGGIDHAAVPEEEAHAALLPARR